MNMKYKQHKISHSYCKVCKEWKNNVEMIAIDVCEYCFKTHDKYGKDRTLTKD